MAGCTSLDTGESGGTPNGVRRTLAESAGSSEDVILLGNMTGNASDTELCKRCRRGNLLSLWCMAGVAKTKWLYRQRGNVGVVVARRPVPRSAPFLGYVGMAAFAGSVFRASGSHRRPEGTG